MQTDVLIVGAGPAGSAAAAWCARRGLDTVLVDAAHFPRDKACGDGLTPRAMAELSRLGQDDWLRAKPTNFGLRAHGFGQQWHLPWPKSRFGRFGSAVARWELDDHLVGVAAASGAKVLTGYRATKPTRSADRVSAVEFRQDDRLTTIECQRLVVADGAKSQLGRTLGREWHRNSVFGVAARAYATTERKYDPWISSHLELRDNEDRLLSGYGWIFPLGVNSAGEQAVNIGVGTLATARRPADVQLRSLLQQYHAQVSSDFQLAGYSRYRSALLPMGGAVSGVAGPNWLLVGDAAGLVNPLNGEGIDYGLESGRLAAELLDERPEDLTELWSAELNSHYGSSFRAARNAAELLTKPEVFAVIGPKGMASRRLMGVALRVMGNLVSPEDTDVVARVWRTAGRALQGWDDRPLFD